jgi:hypothetical protein
MLKRDYEQIARCDGMFTWIVYRLRCPELCFDLKCSIEKKSPKSHFGRPNSAADVLDYYQYYCLL